MANLGLLSDTRKFLTKKNYISPTSAGQQAAKHPSRTPSEGDGATQPSAFAINKGRDVGIPKITLVEECF